MRVKFLISLVLFKAVPVCLQAQCLKPFPQHVQYSPGSIKPSHISQKTLDERVRSFYDAWKDHYLRSACEAGESYVWFDGKGNSQCVSEGQGYGMMIVALMAGYDSSAQKIFDRLFKYYRSHP